MHCYNHHKQEAIGICQKCGKGLCKACCNLGDNYLACSDSCAQIIKGNDEMNKRARALYNLGGKTSARRLPLNTLAYFTFGLIFGGYGLHNYLQYHFWTSTDAFFLILSLFMFCIGFLYWRRAKKTGLNI